MAHAIVLSKDRAAQVHLCLEALQSNAGHIFPNVSVIYHTSNDEFKDGYEIAKKHFPTVNWIMQDSYYNNIMETLNETFKLTSFLTDDDIVYRTVPSSLNQIEANFNELDELGTFSLRLGLNTYIQDPYISSHIIQPTSGFRYVNDRMIMWNWTECPPYGNFGYPLSVDGHIFWTTEIKSILGECRFNNPNQQEVAMQSKLSMLSPLMMSFEQSVVINTPLNRVQDTCMNRAGEIHGQTAESLNKKYLEGYTLNLDSIDFSNIIGCHQELDIKWNTK